MQSLKITPQNAKKLYPTATQFEKQLLHDTFGEKFFSIKPTERIQNLQDALNALELTIDDIRPYKNPVNSRQEAINATEEMFVMAEALQNGWVADYSNKNQEKWYCWLIWDNSVGAFLFYAAGYDDTGASADSGARLSFPDKETAEHFCKIAINQYNKFLTK